MMKINENTTKGRWLEINGDVQKAWGKLSADDLGKSQGNMAIHKKIPVKNLIDKDILK